MVFPGNHDKGNYVELRDVVVTPRYPRGVRILQDVHLPQLLAIVKQQTGVGQVMAKYLETPEGRRCPPEAMKQMLARLYQEGILVSADGTETG